MAMQSFTFALFSTLLCLLAGQGAVAAEKTNHLKTDNHLQGASLGTPAEEVVNQGRLSGYSTFQAKRLINRGEIHLQEQGSSVYSLVDNQGTMEISRVPVAFHREVVNHGRMKITDAQVHFNAPLSIHGSYVSDPSDNYFTDLIVSSMGYMVGGEGDRFFISNDFLSTSTRASQWQTADCSLEFNTGTDMLHQFGITGADLGMSQSGYSNNFAWKSLSLATSNSLQLVDGNATAGGALYVREIIGVQTSGQTVTNISASAGINIYYQPAEATNAYLGGQTYSLGSSGQLIPFGEPADVDVPMMTPWSRTIAIILLILAGGLVRRRQVGWS